MNFTEGNITKKIVTFSVPLFLGSLLQQAYSISDSIIVGNLVGPSALAAIGATMPVMQVSIALVLGITVGVAVVVAQSFGACDTTSVRQTILTSYTFFMAFSIMLTVVGVIFSRYFLILIKVPREILDDATQYLQITFLGTIPKVGYDVSNSIYRGIGDSSIPLTILVLSILLNIALDFLLILVFDLGIKGTAWATVIAQGISFIASFIIFQVKYPQLKLRVTLQELKYTLLRKVMKIGLPSGLKATLYWGGYTFITSTVNKFGANAIAAFGIASRIDLFVQTPQGSLSNGLASFVGQNIGAQKTDRIKQAIRISELIGITIALVSTIGVHVMAEKIINLFTSDVEIIDIGVQYLQIVSLFYVIYSLQEVIQGVAIGSGHTLILMISTIVAMWIVRIPIAFFLSEHIGITGIWLSIPSGWFVAMIFTNAFYLSGRWKHVAAQG
jgi:putative MATE family efflux protein